MNKENIDKKKSKGLLLPILSALATLAAVGCAFYSGYLFGEKRANTQKVENTSQFSESLEPNVVTNNMKLVIKKAANINATYGATEITYEVDTEAHSDVIEAKLEFADGSIPEATVLSFAHNRGEKKITVSCNNVFTQQAVLTIYSDANPSVNAKVTFNFREKITEVTPSITVNEGQPIASKFDVKSTGGTILVDKNVTNVKLEFATDFLKKVNEGVDAYCDTLGWDDQSTYDTYDACGCTPNKDANYWLSNKFATKDFLASLEVKVEDTSGSYYMDDESVTEYTFTAAKMTLDKFNEVFDGNAPVFTLSGTINGGKYSKDLGLKLTAPTVTSISASTGAYTF